jgi:hypothetical protein
MLSGVRMGSQSFTACERLEYPTHYAWRWHWMPSVVERLACGCPSGRR